MQKIKYVKIPRHRIVICHKFCYIRFLLIGMELIPLLQTCFKLEKKFHSNFWNFLTLWLVESQSLNDFFYQKQWFVVRKVTLNSHLNWKLWRDDWQFWSCWTLIYSYQEMVKSICHQMLHKQRGMNGICWHRSIHTSLVCQTPGDTHLLVITYQCSTASEVSFSSP